MSLGGRCPSMEIVPGIQIQIGAGSSIGLSCPFNCTRIFRYPRTLTSMPEDRTLGYWPIILLWTKTGCSYVRTMCRKKVCIPLIWVVVCECVRKLHLLLALYCMVLNYPVWGDIKLGCTSCYSKFWNISVNDDQSPAYGSLSV